MQRFIAVSLMLLIVVVTAFGEGAKEEDAEAIARDYYNTIIRGYETGDIDLYMSVFSEDVVAMPPDSPLVIGAEKYRTMAQPFFDPSVKVEVAIEPQEAAISGDWLFTRCSATHSITPVAGGETMTMHSKVLEVLERQEDGSWKCHTVCWNSE